MGASNSRELFKRRSKRRKCGENVQFLRQGLISSNENIAASYDERATIHCSNERDEGAYTFEQVDNDYFDPCHPKFQGNYWENEAVGPVPDNFNISPALHTRRKSYLNQFSTSDGNCHNDEFVGVGNLESTYEEISHRQDAISNHYKEDEFRRPLLKHHSFNDNHFQFKDDGRFMQSSKLRSNSLNDISNQDIFRFGGQYMEDRYSNVDGFNGFNNNVSIGRSRFQNRDDRNFNHRGVKRDFCDYYTDDKDFWSSSSNHGSNGSGEESMNYNNPGESITKRRLSNENQDNFISSKKNEKTKSELSLYNQSSNSSEESGNINSVSSSNLKNEMNGALDILCFPSQWSSMAIEKTGYVNISFSSPEGKSVLKFFGRSSKTKDFMLTITSIIRIENPFLHTLYMLKKEELAVRNGHVDELYLYHGTKKKVVSKICDDNLDWRKCVHRHKFGKGVSFSPIAHYSSHYSDDKPSDRILLLCKVLVSNSVIGTEEMIVPPDFDGTLFDTSIKEEASVIVKYSDNEFYPLYKIIYTKH